MHVQPPTTPPRAAGTTAKTPFAHLLVHIFRHQFTGTLVLESDGAQLAIYFRSGRPAKVQTSHNRHRLGEMLVEAKALTAAQLRDAVQGARQAGVLLGQYLVEKNLISAEQLVAAITDQMMLQMVEGFTMQAARFSFYQDVNLLAAREGEMVVLDSHALVVAGLRLYADIVGSQVNRTLAALRGKWLYLADSAAVRPFKFAAKEMAVCRFLAKNPADFAVLKTAFPDDTASVKVVLCALRLFDVLGVADTREAAQQAVGGAVSSDPPPDRPSAQALDPKIVALREEIGQRIARLASQNYYQMLDLEPGADIPTIRTAFFRMAKKFHPDRAAKPELADMKDALAFLFTNLSEAHAALTDPDQKEAYDAALRAPSGTPAPGGAAQAGAVDEAALVQAAIEADRLYQRAVLAMRHNRWDEAAQLTNEALALQPDNEACRVQQVFLACRSGVVPSEEQLGQLRNLGRENPKHERIQVQLGHIFKKADRQREALQYFRTAVDINPHNIDAAREVRLIERALRTSTPPKRGGLFGLFKK